MKETIKALEARRQGIIDKETVFTFKNYCEAMSVIKELYAENQALKADKWQAVESAPRDCAEWFILSAFGHSLQARRSDKLKGFITAADCFVPEFSADGWMPLPEAALQSKGGRYEEAYQTMQGM